MENNSKTIEIITLPISMFLCIEPALISVINRGYNKPRYRFGIIDAPRMKHSLYQDLLVKDPEHFYMSLCIAPLLPSNTDVEFNEDDDGSTLTKKLIEAYPIDALSQDDIVFSYSEERLLELISMDSSGFEFRILGSIAIKPFNGSLTNYELTALTSFYPKVSKIMMNFIDDYSHSKLSIETLWADVITEHDLVDYYKKNGYSTVKIIECKIDKETKMLVGDEGYLEDGIKANSDFTLTLMKKDL